MSQPIPDSEKVTILLDCLRRVSWVVQQAGQRQNLDANLVVNTLNDINATISRIGPLPSGPLLGYSIQLRVRCGPHERVVTTPRFCLEAWSWESFKLGVSEACRDIRKEVARHGSFEELCRAIPAEAKPEAQVPFTRADGKVDWAATYYHATGRAAYVDGRWTDDYVVWLGKMIEDADYRLKRIDSRLSHLGVQADDLAKEIRAVLPSTAPTPV